MTQALSDSGMPGATRSGVIDRRLAGAWRREWRFVIARGLGRLIVWLAAMAAVDFLLDWQIDLPGGWRMGLLALNVVVALGVLFWDALRRLKAFDPLRVALQVERLYPKLQSLLVSYVQLHENPEAHEGSSPALVRAMCREADVQVRPLDFGKIVRFRTLRNLLLIVVLATGVEAAAAYWQPAFLRAFLDRMSNPNSLAEYPTATIVVEVSPHDIRCQQGANVTLSLTVTGELPGEATLYIKQDGSPREAIELTYDAKAAMPLTPLPTTAPTTAPTSTSAPAAPRRTFTYEVEHAAKDFTFWFHAGDVNSKKFRVEMVPPPTMKAFVRLESPAYTRIDPREADTAGLDVLAGTKLVWKLKFDRPVDKVTMQGLPGLKPGDQPLSKDLKISDSGLEAVSDFPVVAGEAFSYGFLVVDRKADRKDSFTYPPEVSYSVSVHADRDPTLAITATDEPSAATTDKKISLSFRAEDDYGLTNSRIVWWLSEPAGTDLAAKDAPKRKENVWPLKGYANQPLEVSEQEIVWKVKEAIPGLKAGDVVEYLVEVVDNCQPTPNVARSREYRLEILSREDYDRRIAEREEELLKRLRQLADTERGAAMGVSDINRQGEATTQPATKP
ncbi:MAG: hypothetical protein NTV86_23020 [Planctomycetota bacterium]|nr:hypothetical protein [Planctomycetota bacterium]